MIEEPLHTALANHIHPEVRGRRLEPMAPTSADGSNVCRGGPTPEQSSEPASGKEADCICVQGYITDKKPRPPLGPPLDPK